MDAEEARRRRREKLLKRGQEIDNPSQAAATPITPVNLVASNSDPVPGTFDKGQINP